MSNKDKESPTSPAKGRGKGIMMMGLMAIAMLAVGGGGAFALVKAGVVGGDRPHEDNAPRLLHKGDADPFAPKADGGKDAAAPADVEGDGGSPYRTTYYTFADDFTSNLKGSTALVQLSIACSTHRDGRVLIWLKKHELAIRSSILEILADTPEEDVATIAGKERLQQRMTAAINKVLNENEGFGGVDNVYFKSFLVQ